MIRINLLPVEKRKAERTPLPRFGLVVLDVAVLTAIAFYCVFLFFRISQVEQQIAELQAERERLEPEVKQHQALTTKKGALEAAHREIGETTNRKVEWWRAMDAVWEVIHNNPRVWITDLQTVDGNGAAGAAKSYNPEFADTPPYGVFLRCYCGGRDVAQFTKFRKDLKRNADVKKYFKEINWDAQWTLQSEPEYVEQYSMSFDIRLIGKAQPPPAPAPATPAGGTAR